jgi:hypothetical protein
MTTSTNNPNAEALVIAFQKRDDQDADWRKKIAATVEALEKSAANGGFTWNGKTYTSVKKWVPVALKITYRAWRYRVTGGNQKRGTKKKKGETSVSPNQLSGINVNINGFTLNENSAWVSVEFGQEHRLTYKGAKRNGTDWSQGYPDKDPNAEWIHNVRDVHGTLSFTVENEDGTLDTDKKLVAALLKKMTTILKFMRIWKDSLVEDFKTMVAVEADWQEERKEVRRRAAKKGAATRKTKSESGVQKKIDALREFNARNAGEKKAKQPDTTIHVSLTKAQANVIETLPPFDGGITPKGCGFLGKGRGKRTNTLIFEADKYQETVKALVLALEQRAKDVQDEHYKARRGFRATELLDWTNKYPEGIAAKQKDAERKGARKAIEGVIRAIIAGDLKSDDPARHAREWYEHHEEEVQTELGAASERLDAEFEVKWGNQETLSEPAKNLQAAIVAAGDVAVSKPWEDDPKAWKQKSWSDRVCTPGSPEREEHLRQLLHRQEFPYVDPNEGDDHESDEEIL